MTFKILRGSHAERIEDGKLKVYGRGSTFHSKTDLTKLNRGHHKFQLISDKDDHPVQSSAENKAPPKVVNDALDEMKVEELRRMADDEEIDVSGLKTKAEIVERIRASV